MEEQGLVKPDAVWGTTRAPPATYRAASAIRAGYEAAWAARGAHLICGTCYPSSEAALSAGEGEKRTVKAPHASRSPGGSAHMMVFSDRDEVDGVVVVDRCSPRPSRSHRWLGALSFEILG